MIQTPTTPIGSGTSPNIKGEVTRRKRGVKAISGTAIERSETFIAFK